MADATLNNLQPADDGFLSYFADVRGIAGDFAAIATSAAQATNQYRTVVNGSVYGTNPNVQTKTVGGEPNTSPGNPSSASAFSLSSPWLWVGLAAVALVVVLFVMRK